MKNNLVKKIVAFVSFAVFAGALIYITVIAVEDIKQARLMFDADYALWHLQIPFYIGLVFCSVGAFLLASMNYTKPKPKKDDEQKLYYSYNKHKRPSRA